MNWPDVNAWRKTARAKLIGARIAVPAPVRVGWTEALATGLREALATAPAPISFYWPFKAEPDLRPLMRELDAQGIAVALPVAVRLGEAMTFRPWQRGAPMERGLWDIPIPATREEIVPRTVIAPLVGFDGRNYRLGYGGGFFDHTLAKLGPAAQPIGVGFSLFRLETIHPQAHDVAMTLIVTEQPAADVGASASPVCYLDEADPDYSGFLPDADLAAALRPLATSLPPERQPLLEFILWRLTGSVGQETPQLSPSADPDPAASISRLLPRVRDDGIHLAIRILRDSVSHQPATASTLEACR